MKNRFTGRLGGFTLIELLVVVLIIGILAAIALPKYEKAVNRARYTQAQTLLNSIWHAEQVYYMANGSYTTHFSDLDIDLPKKENIREESDGTRYRYNRGSCKLHGTGYGQCNIKVGKGLVWYMRRWTPGSGTFCWVYPPDNQQGHDLCRTMTGKEGTIDDSGMYVVYPF